MSLEECTIKHEYRSLIDNVVQEFYIPLLKEATLYQRAVGFFSSSSLVEISKGIAAMASAGGRIQIVASPYLSDEDIDAIKRGYEGREKIMEDALLRQLSDEHMDYYSMERLNLLANLIADGVLDIRIAYTEDSKGIGMYHEKMGLIRDAEGNVVAFSGSMNESATAMLVNYETIDVFRSWGDQSERDRVTLKQNAFTSIWMDTEPNIHVLEFPKVTEALIEKYRKKAPDFTVDSTQYASTRRRTRRGTGITAIGARVPSDVVFHPYQEEAIAAWVGENYRGIYDMATGTGKTFTGLGSIAKISEDLDDELAVIIVCPYQHLVEQWVEDIVRFNIKPIIGYSSSAQKDWKKRLANAIRDQKIRPEKRFFCFVCTNATFANVYVQEQISRIRTPILLVVDEAHNVGARSYARWLDDRFTYRLALSATLDRHHDEEGTALLYNFFGKKCIEYPLERAINEDKLTPYKYFPVLVYLNEDESLRYDKLSYEMSRCLIKDKNGKYKLNKRGEILALQRARIVAGAAQKLDALRAAIEPYIHDNNILVYCGATNVLDENSDKIEQNLIKIYNSLQKLTMYKESYVILCNDLNALRKEIFQVWKLMSSQLTSINLAIKIKSYSYDMYVNLRDVIFKSEKVYKDILHLIKKRLNDLTEKVNLFEEERNNIIRALASIKYLLYDDEDLTAIYNLIEKKLGIDFNNYYQSDKEETQEEDEDSLENPKENDIILQDIKSYQDEKKKIIDYINKIDNNIGNITIYE